MDRLRVEDVSKRYGGEPVLEGVSLGMAGGEALVVRGPSGSGKSTLLQVMGLQEHPSSGRVLIDGQDAGALDAEARARLRLRRVGYVFQTHNMIPQLTLLENVLLPMRFAKRPDRARAEGLLRRVGLGDQLDALPGAVSVGQRQRAAIARALANGPDLLLADEPTASLDDESAGEVATLLQELVENGVAVVIASHDARVAAALPNARSVQLVRGRATSVVA